MENEEISNSQSQGVISTIAIKSVPLSLLVDIGSILYALVSGFDHDWLIRSNFQLHWSDNLHKDSHQNSWMYPRVKREKDRTVIESWRPIFLINVDAKIMSKVIASKTKNVLPHIIHQRRFKKRSNNGLSSEFFNITRGVRQRDPLSMYLFLLAVQTLAIAVREDVGIKDIVIEQEEYFSSMLMILLWFFQM